MEKDFFALISGKSEIIAKLTLSFLKENKLPLEMFTALEVKKRIWENFNRYLNLRLLSLAEEDRKEVVEKILAVNSEKGLEEILEKYWQEDLEIVYADFFERFQN
ncbi:MAG: hypothetical protein MUF50_01155 [Planctomycetes bacterium]|jgi:hypothetical protein|nr:hypothetical protein [Planctomycetota bacterium]